MPVSDGTPVTDVINVFNTLCLLIIFYRLLACALPGLRRFFAMAVFAIAPNAVVVGNNGCVLDLGSWLRVDAGLWRQQLSVGSN